jgi:integrase
MNLGLTASGQNQTDSGNLIYYSIDKTESSYQRSFEDFALKRKEPLSEKLILEWLEEKKKTRTGKDKKSNTFVSMLKAVQKYLDLNSDLKETQKAKLNKTISALVKRYKVKVSKAISREQVLSVEEIEKLAECLWTKPTVKDNAGNYNPDKYRILSLIIRSLYWTGCRIAELLNAVHEDCTLSESGKTVNVQVLGKGSKIRNTPIIPVKLYKEIIKVTGNKEGLIFRSKRDTPLNTRNIYREIKSAGKEFLGKEIYPHIFRHSRASHIYEKTKDVKLVQEYLGHSSAKTTLDMYVFMDLKKREKDLL